MRVSEHNHAAQRVQQLLTGYAITNGGDGGGLQQAPSGQRLPNGSTSGHAGGFRGGSGSVSGGVTAGGTTPSSSARALMNRANRMSGLVTPPRHTTSSASGQKGDPYRSLTAAAAASNGSTHGRQAHTGTGGQGQGGSYSAVSREDRTSSSMSTPPLSSATSVRSPSAGLQSSAVLQTSTIRDRDRGRTATPPRSAVTASIAAAAAASSMSLFSPASTVAATSSSPATRPTTPAAALAAAAAASSAPPSRESNGESAAGVSSLLVKSSNSHAAGAGGSSSQGKPLARRSRPGPSRFRSPSSLTRARSHLK